MDIGSLAPYILSSVVAPALGWGVYALRAKTDVWRMSKQADITVATTPFNVLQQVLQARDKENMELREWINKIVTNHLEHDAQDRQGVAAAMQDLASSQRELTAMIREDRQAAAKRDESVAKTLTDIRVDLGRLH